MLNDRVATLCVVTACILCLSSLLAVHGEFVEQQASGWMSALPNGTVHIVALVPVGSEVSFRLPILTSTVKFGGVQGWKENSTSPQGAVQLAIVFANATATRVIEQVVTSASSPTLLGLPSQQLTGQWSVVLSSATNSTPEQTLVAVDILLTVTPVDGKRDDDDDDDDDDDSHKKEKKDKKKHKKGKGHDSELVAAVVVVVSLTGIVLLGIAACLRLRAVRRAKVQQQKVGLLYPDSSEMECGEYAVDPAKQP